MWLVVCLLMLISILGYLNHRSGLSRPWVQADPRHGIPTRWGWVVWRPEGLILGNSVDIGWGTFLQASHCIRIGNDVQIGSYCSIYSRDTISDRMGQVTIERGARVGAHTVILPDVVIGAGAVVGAHSLVLSGTRIKAGETWFGVPARRMK